MSYSKSRDLEIVANYMAEEQLRAAKFAGQGETNAVVEPLDDLRIFYDLPLALLAKVVSFVH